MSRTAAHPNSAASASGAIYLVARHNRAGLRSAAWTRAADELYGVGFAPYDEVMASRSKDASLEITLLVLLIVLVVITVLTFLA